MEINKEQQQDQPLSNTLSGTSMYTDLTMFLNRELKLLDGMNKAKTLEIEQLIKHKENQL